MTGNLPAFASAGSHNRLAQQRERWLGYFRRYIPVLLSPVLLNDVSQTFPDYLPRYLNKFTWFLSELCVIR
jgi:hypothetical protein